MTAYLHFTYDDIHNELPYKLIAETASRSIWDTGKRKRRMAQVFTESERRQISRIIAQSKTWALVRGVPDKGVDMTAQTYRLWMTLADFCVCL